MRAAALPRRLARVAAAASACLLAGCATAPQLAPAVRDAVIREATAPWPAVAIASADGQLHAEVEAAAAPAVTRDERDPDDPTAYRIEIPIGDDEPIRCTVTGQSYAIGSAAARMLSDKLVDASIQQRIAGLDAGVAGERPYLYAQVVGTAHDSGEAALYQAKFFFAPLRFGALYCAHVGLGYSETVRRVASGLLASIAFAPQTDDAPPAYHEVTLTRVGPLTCGFSETRYYQRADGGWGAVLRSVLVAPHSPSAATGLDHLRVTSADADGVVERAASDSYADGKRLFSLALEREPLGFGYAVSGEMAGRAVDDTLPGRTPLRDDVSLARQIAAGTRGGTWSMAQWVPEVEPLRAVDVAVTCPPRAAGADVPCDVQAGRLHVAALMDANGMARTATLHTGAVEMSFERVYARGGF